MIAITKVAQSKVLAQTQITQIPDSWMLGGFRKRRDYIFHLRMVGRYAKSKKCNQLQILFQMVVYKIFM